MMEFIRGKEDCTYEDACMHVHNRRCTTFRDLPCVRHRHRPGLPVIGMGPVRIVGGEHLVQPAYIPPCMGHAVTPHGDVWCDDIDLGALTHAIDHGLLSCGKLDGRGRMEVFTLEQKNICKGGKKQK